VVPLYDVNPTVRKPVALIVLLSLNILAWFFLQRMGSEEGLARSLCQFGLVPGDLLGTIADNTIIPLGQKRALPIGWQKQLGNADNVYVHARWMDASHW